MNLRLILAGLASLVVVSGCHKSSTQGGAVAVDAAPAASVEPPEPESPKELFDAYQETLGSLAEQGQYTDVCKGSPWFAAAICQWVAARAEGKAVGLPDSELFRGLFYREHWVHAWGSIVSDADNNGNYEASVSGYRNHVVLDTVDTRFSSKGRFDLWVQEQPETQEVTLNSGSTANWVVLAEMPLAKALMDLAHSGANLESTGIAKDAMKLIALYDTYAVLKGTFPPLPGAPQPSASAAPAVTANSTASAPQAQQPPPGTSSPSASAAPPTVSVGALPRAVPVSAPVPGGPTRSDSVGALPRAVPVSAPVPRGPTRSDCIRKCVASCSDDANCERTCVGNCPSG